MSRGKERDLALDVELLGVEPGEVVERLVHECHVGAPVAQQQCLLADLAQQDFNRCRTGFARKHVEEPLQELVRRPGLRREHRRPLQIPRAPSPPGSGRDRVEGRSGLAEQHPVGVGERRSMTVAVEELDAEPPFKLPDCAGERRLGDSEPNGGASEVHLLGDSDEVPQFAGLKIAHGQKSTARYQSGIRDTELILDNERATRRAWTE